MGFFGYIVDLSLIICVFLEYRFKGLGCCFLFDLLLVLVDFEFMMLLYVFVFNMVVCRIYNGSRCRCYFCIN